MAYQDPWAWADEQQRLPPVPQTNNTLQVPTANAQQPQITQGPPGIGQMAEQILVARGVNKGIDAGVNAMTPTPAGPLAPVVDAGGAVEILPSAAQGAGTAATAAEVGGTAAAATEGAAVASAGATAATAGAGAAEAGTLAAMGPVGWGVGALLLAKQMKWI